MAVYQRETAPLVAHYEAQGIVFANNEFDFLRIDVIGDLEGEGRDSGDPAIEVMVAVHPGEAWTLKGFYMTDELAGTGETSDLINVWTSYTTGGLTLAAPTRTIDSGNPHREDSSERAGRTEGRRGPDGDQGAHDRPCDEPSHRHSSRR